MYRLASREHFLFHLSYVDKDLPEPGGTGFETTAMRRLYDYGYDKARTGSFWVGALSQTEAAKEAQVAVQIPFTNIPVAHRF